MSTFEKLPSNHAGDPKETPSFINFDETSAWTVEKRFAYQVCPFLL